MTLARSGKPFSVDGKQTIPADVDSSYLADQLFLQSSVRNTYISYQNQDLSEIYACVGQHEACSELSALGAAPICSPGGEQCPLTMAEYLLQRWQRNS